MNNYDTAIKALESEIASWERDIQESRDAISRVDRNVAGYQSVIDCGNERIAELRAAIAALSPPTDRGCCG